VISSLSYYPKKKLAIKKKKKKSQKEAQGVEIAKD
jgi:hypothetical protein